MFGGCVAGATASVPLARIAREASDNHAVSTHSGRALRVSPAGVRGIVGPGLTSTTALEFCAAFAAFLTPSGPVVLGRDPRASSRMLREAALAALMASGRDVIDLGITSTPIVQQAIRRLPA